MNSLEGSDTIPNCELEAPVEGSETNPKKLEDPILGSETSPNWLVKLDPDGSDTNPKFELLPEVKELLLIPDGSEI